MIIKIPVELVSESNIRENHFAKARRKKRQRKAVRQAWLIAGSPSVLPPVMLRLTRIHTSRRKIRDFDNLVGSFKAVIDEVAQIIGIDDKDIIWPEKMAGAFQQELGSEMGCRMEVISVAGTGDDLTELQAEFLSRWTERAESLGYSPSLRQMEELQAWNAQQLMDYVVAKGFISRDKGVSRGTSLTETGQLWLLKQRK